MLLAIHLYLLGLNSNKNLSHQPFVLIKEWRRVCALEVAS
jgi:hypothetical protein